MKVRLMLTCLCDAFYGEVGIATVRVLEHAGCFVEFPKDQTCCGQPPFNAGDWAESRKVAERFKHVFSGADMPIVTPSSSCAAMVREGYHLLFGSQSPTPEVYELSEFLVHKVGIDAWPKTSSLAPVTPRKVAYHRACHGRSIGLTDEQEKLLKLVPGLEVVPLESPEQCCGFGGAFCIGLPTVSAGIGNEKLRTAVETGADTLVSGDMGCLIHLNGLIGKAGLRLETRHFAEILADAIPAPVPA